MPVDLGCPLCQSHHVRPLSTEGLHDQLVRFLCEACGRTWAEEVAPDTLERLLKGDSPRAASS